jgi:hypothetical protein
MSNPFVATVSVNLLLSLVAGLNLSGIVRPRAEVDEDPKSPDCLFVGLMMFAAFAEGGVPLLRFRTVAVPSCTTR